MRLGSIHAVLNHISKTIISLFITSYELSGANNVGVGMINGNIETKRLEHNELKIDLVNCVG